jgi:hypothetical protein
MQTAFSGTVVEDLLKLANLRCLAAYFARCLVWLRALALTGVSCVALYFYSLPQPLIAVVYWNVFYTVLNSNWIDWLTRRWRTSQA